MKSESRRTLPVRSPEKLERGRERKGRDTDPKLLEHADGEVSRDKGTIISDAKSFHFGHDRKIVDEHLELGRT